MRKKSVFIPTQMITFLENVINSVSTTCMTVTLPKEKVDHIKDKYLRLQKKNKTSIREISRVIGILVSFFSAVDYGTLHYRILEKEKNYALKKSFGNYNAYMNVTNNMKSELNWWSDNIHSQNRIIDRGNADISITTDTSLEGWGAVETFDGNIKANGRWNQEEKVYHINYLEHLAILYALKALM